VRNYSRAVVVASLVAGLIPAGAMAATAAVTRASAASTGVAASTTELTLSTGSVTYGDEQAETLSVTVAPASGSGTPTGSVAVTSGTTSVCDISLSPSGTGSCVLTATDLAPGSAQLTAAYSGDATYASSASAAEALTVAPDPTATSLTVPTAKATYGAEQHVTVSVKVTPKYSGTPSGSVTLKAGSATVAVLTLKTGTAKYTLAATRLAAGTVKLTAGYSGSADFSSSTSGAKTLTISKATTTTVLALSHTTVPYGDESAARISVAIRPRYSGTPSGSVTVKAGTATICKITLKSARGTCSLAKTRLAAGTVKLTAGYSGSADFSSSRSGAKTLTISKSSSTTALTVSKANVQYGSEQGEKISVKVTPKFSGSLTGTVTVKAGSAIIAVIRLSSGQGSYTFTSKKLKVGKYTLVATYSGNADYTGSRSAGKSLTVSAPPPPKPSCYPLSNEGTCYEPGEYCRNDDHGAHGIAGDGKPIVCEDNNGWRWEPVN
jgi:hypothetical protein